MDRPLVGWHLSSQRSTAKIERTENDVNRLPPADREAARKATSSSTSHHALLDSGASYSVVGLPLIRKWRRNDEELWKRCSVSSHKQFRFGSGEMFISLGSVLINAIATSLDGFPIRLVLMLDLIDSPAPLLLPRRCLARMRGKLDFSTNEIQIDSGVEIATFVSSGGHILLPIQPASVPLLKTCSSASIYSVGNLDHSVDEEMIDSPLENTDNEAPGASELSSEDVLKIHRQLGHASRSSLSRLIKLSKRKCTDQSIAEALRKCSCHRIDNSTQRPFGNIHLLKPSETWFLQMCFSG